MYKRIVSFFSLVLAFSLFGCTAGVVDTESSSEALSEILEETYVTIEETEVFDETPFVVDISEYTLVYPEKSSDYFLKYVDVFCERIYQYTGVSIVAYSDANPIAKKEILLGQTNRELSVAASKRVDRIIHDVSGYCICFDDNAIAINGRDEISTLRAMKVFLMNYADACEEQGSVYFANGEAELGLVKRDSILFDDYTEFTPNFTSVVSNPTDPYGKTTYSYETLIELTHNAGANGKLIATHAGLYGQDGYKIMESNDSGRTWKYLCTVKDELTPHKTISSLQPCLFELPKDMGDFKEGTLFLAACTQGKIEGVPVVDLVLYYSTDLGQSWTTYCNLAHGPKFSEDFNESRAVWEPVLYYDEATDRVYCFYSDETDPKAGDYVQKLVCKYTTDMVNWSDAVDIINGDDPALRPGMLSVAKMGNGEYFMVYEIYSENGCPIYFQKTDSLESFSPKDYGQPLESVDGKRLGSSPWCAWSPVGGECGTLIVVANHMNKGNALNGKVDMFVSRDYGETFIAVSNPIHVSNVGDSKKMKISYSPHVSFSADGSTLYYLNNPAYSVSLTKVVFCSIKIW